MGTILVADDDRTCRDSIQKVLEREGHAVKTAENVDEALEALELNHFDLIVCDYRMPGKTGLDLMIELSRKHSAVPVLMISAYADESVEAAVLKLGGLDVLKKPIRRQELIQRTAKVVGGWGETSHGLHGFNGLKPA
jgi:DNA-binding response OmpR family regulator